MPSPIVIPGKHSTHMKPIPITQFLRPDGERRYLVCDVNDDVADLYRAR
jgi:hypothetical protein